MVLLGLSGWVRLAWFGCGLGGEVIVVSCKIWGGLLCVHGLVIFLCLSSFFPFLPLLGGRYCNSDFLCCASMLVIHYILCLVCTSILW